MDKTLLILLAGLLAAAVWTASLWLRDAAVSTARRVCSEQGLQFLDGSAILRRIRLTRAGTGSLQLQATYTFDYSSDGYGRSTGCVILDNGRVSTVLLND